MRRDYYARLDAYLKRVCARTAITASCLFRSAFGLDLDMCVLYHTTSLCPVCALVTRAGFSPAPSSIEIVCVHHTLY